MAVVQLGLAINLDFLVSFPLISGTTSGISGLYRKALYFSGVGVGSGDSDGGE